MRFGLRPVLGVFALAAVLAVSACGSSDSGGSSSTGSSGSTSSAGTSTAGSATGVSVGTTKPVGVKAPLRIAYLMNGTVNQYLQAAANSAKDYAKEKGIQLDVIDGQFSPEKQLNQAQNALQSKKYNAFMVMPIDSNLVCKSFSQQAPEQGVLVSVLVLPVCGHTLDTGEKIWQPGTLNFVGSNNTTTFATAFYEASAKANPGKQTVAFLLGPKLLGQTQVALAALKSWQSTHPDFDVKYLLYTEGETTPEGLEQTQTLLQAHPDVTVIMSIYADMTVGAVKAIKAAGKTGQIKVTDVGGSAANVALIKDGSQQLTIPYFPKDIPRIAIDSLLAAVDGEADPPRYVSDIPPKWGTPDNPGVITKDNVGTFTPQY